MYVFGSSSVYWCTRTVIPVNLQYTEHNQGWVEDEKFGDFVISARYMMDMWCHVMFVIKFSKLSFHESLSLSIYHFTQNV